MPKHQAGRRGKEDTADAWLCGMLYDAGRDQSCLCILDAARLESGPVCKIWCHDPMPNGLHGCYSSTLFSLPTSPTRNEIVFNYVMTANRAFKTQPRPGPAEPTTEGCLLPPVTTPPLWRVLILNASVVFGHCSMRRRLVSVLYTGHVRHPHHGHQTLGVAG